MYSLKRSGTPHRGSQKQNNKVLVPWDLVEIPRTVLPGKMCQLMEAVSNGFATVPDMSGP